MMQERTRIKYVHEGRYVAEVEVALIDDDSGWAPYLSAEDAFKLDDVRTELKRGNLEAASRLGVIYEMRPVFNS